MSKSERLAALEINSAEQSRRIEMMRSCMDHIDADIRNLRTALDQYAETVKGLTGKIAIKPNPPWTGGELNKWPIPPITKQAAEKGKVP